VREGWKESIENEGFNKRKGYEERRNCKRKQEEMKQIGGRWRKERRK
jgi:hypothetical protein